MRSGICGAVVASLLVLGAACSDDGASSTEPSGTPATSAPADSLALGDPCPPGDPVLRVDEIAAAVAAVETELGGPQRYFEINATTAFVNLFVASADETKVTPYVWAAGELSSRETVEAQGNTFEAAALDIDPQLVSACIAAELPNSSQDVFIVEGGEGGVVRYTILTTSSVGGQLLVEVSGDGAVLAVDPVDG